MKTLLRILLGLAVLGLVALAAIIFVPPVTTRPAENLAADWKPAPGQGLYATRMADCAACHTAPEGESLAGGRAIESPMGVIWSSNITADPNTGIGDWTLDQFRASLVDGIGADGEHLYPAMPYENYRKLSEQDIRAIYDYLMHEAAPVENAVKETELAFPFNQRWGIRLWNWVALGKAGFQPVAETAADDALARGAYLVEGPGHCAACHSPRNVIMAQDGGDASSSAFLTGGEIGGWSAPDLRTAHSALQNWSDEDLKDFLTTGRNNHSAVTGEMNLVVSESLQYMTDEDADAMVAYLRSISTVEPQPLPHPPHDQILTDRLAAANDPTTAKLKAAMNLTPGERLYLDNCNACHMADGRGAAGVFPSLVGNSLVTADQTTGLTQTVLYGAEMPSTEKRPERLRMPAFNKRLSNADVATLETFLRSAWGNSASAVDEAAIAAQRN
ncbi:cytochrome c, mono- and diheme variants family [Hoeflea sp. IMCC20628]|uniref:cytochrome c n=1 Tax=Hoeflea sp. IMCC20628 TaxID=1620421 RepID=UPI00063A8C73|nr:cytochrome c [Hoeflea sp. IMCC20628]AKI02077.1 cytochrome c, mono- and diheme variants family [Hoeflea sp. IMCC20628]